MYPDRSNLLAAKLCNEIKKLASGKAELKDVLRAQRNLLRSCGGKVGDDSRLALRDLKQAAELNKGIEQAATVAVQSLAHEFDSLHGELHQTKSGPKPAEGPKPDLKKSDSK